MESNSINNAMKDAEYSLAVEGMSVDENSKELCKELLSGSITLDDYLMKIAELNGVSLNAV